MNETSENWCWIDALDHEQMQKYVQEHPECVTTFKRYAHWDYGTRAQCTLIGHALCPVSRVPPDIVKALIERVSADDICYIWEEKNMRVDVLSTAVLARRYVEYILTTKRLAVVSLQKAIFNCQHIQTKERTVINRREREERTRPYRESERLLQQCLDQQSNVFAATVWSFRQAFVGDHQTIFDTLAEVWRNGFYYHF